MGVELTSDPGIPSLPHQAQGILQQQAQAGFWYNAAMAIYFLAVIRYSVKDRTIQRYEKVFHVVTFVFLEIVAITPAFYGAYNPMWFSELGCWFGPWPIGCVGDECERGQHFFYLGIFCAIIFQVATFAIISVCNILIFRTFRKQENQMRRYQSGGDRRLSREIAIQGFLYSGAALNTVFWGFLSLIMGTIENISEEALLFFSLMVCIRLCMEKFAFLCFLHSYKVVSVCLSLERLHVPHPRFLQLYYLCTTSVHSREKASRQ